MVTQSRCTGDPLHVEVLLSLRHLWSLDRWWCPKLSDASAFQLHVSSWRHETAQTNKSIMLVCKYFGPHCSSTHPSATIAWSSLYLHCNTLPPPQGTSHQAPHLRPSAPSPFISLVVILSSYCTLDQSIKSQVKPGGRSWRRDLRRHTHGSEMRRRTRSTDVQHSMDVQYSTHGQSQATPTPGRDEDRLLAFKTAKVLTPAIDWYLSSARWGERMHNHNYRELWSLIYSWFIFVNAFHLYSLALWSWKDRFPFTLLRSDAACSRVSFYFLPASIHSPTKSIFQESYLNGSKRSSSTLWEKIAASSTFRVALVSARTLPQFQSGFIRKCVSNIQRGEAIN